MKLKKKGEYLLNIDQKNKFAAAQLKIFLVTCIFGNKNTFPFFASKLHIVDALHYVNIIDYIIVQTKYKRWLNFFKIYLKLL